ncbi:MAG: hypothetical protein CMH50_12870 [Myxococcales bacterium]|nr:hypothetical protein [Myxococcales bacterium]
MAGTQSSAIEGVRGSLLPSRHSGLDAMLSLLLAGQLLGQGVPPPEPQGNQLLWSQALAFDHDGMPMVPVGIMEGRKKLQFRLLTRAELLVGEGSEERSIRLRKGSVVEMTLKASEAGELRHFLVTDRYPMAERQAAYEALAEWRQKGFPRARLLPLGISFGLTGTGFDNRALALALDHRRSHQQAEKLQRKIRKHHALETTIQTVASLLPAGQIQTRVGRRRYQGGNRMALRPDAGHRGAFVVVIGVEFGEGYAWHGFENRRYAGQVEVVLDATGHLALVVVTRAEDLVAGTVPSESYVQAPLAALQAQAIASRTELFSKLGHRHGGAPWLLVDDQRDQVYKGEGARHPNSDKAVQTTRGKLLFEGKKLSHAYYSSMCGGHTEDNDHVWDQDPSPVLRGQLDGIEAAPPRNDDEALEQWIEEDEAQPWCRRSTRSSAKYYRWSRRVRTQEIADKLTELGLADLRSWQIQGRGVSGRILQMQLRDSKGRTALLNRELPIRRFFQQLPSALFVVHADRDESGQVTALHFRGRGWGHGVGMCQVGAIGMAEAKHSVEEILEHYYRGATVRTAY